MDEPVLLKAFDGLVGDESKVDSKAYSKERVEVVQRARDELQASQVAEQDGLHRIIRDNFPKVSLQYQSAKEIQTKLKETQGSLESLEESMRSTDALTQPLLTLLQSRAHHLITQRSSSAHLQALQELQGHVKQLQELENDIRAGHGDLRGKEQVFWTGNYKGKGREGINLEVQSEVLRHARATGQLQDRARFLRSLYVSRIEDGYHRAIHFELSDASSGCEIHRSIKLKSQSANGKKLATKAPTTSFDFILRILDDYQKLGPLLEVTRSRFSEVILKPLIRHSVNAKEQARLAIREDGDVRRIAVEVRATELKDSGKDADLYGDLEALFESLARAFSITSIEGRNDDVLNAQMEDLRYSLARESIRVLLEDRLKAGSPANRYLLQGWAKRISAAAEFESKLSGAFQGKPFDSISRFFAEEAGQFWAQKQKDTILDRARGIIAGGWEGWESVEVKKEQRIGAMPMETPRIMDDHAVRDLGVSAEAKPSEAEAGWGFDDWSVEEEPKTATTEPAAASTSEAPADADSGWGFDEDDLSPSKASPPKPIVPPVKPIRQARKLGKKQKQHLADQETEDSMSTSVYSDGGSAGPSAAPSETAETATEGWNDSVAWEEPVVDPIVESKPTQPESQIIVERYQVSKACDSLLEVILNVLEIAQGLETVNLPGGSFNNLAETVQSVAAEILQLYGDLMPKAHAAQIDHVPALAMQFSNDCNQIADVVESMAQTSNWDPTDPVAELRELSEIAYEKQMSVQRQGILEDVAMAEGFEGSTIDRTFDRQKQVMSQIRHKLEMLHRVWMTVLTEARCLSSIGLLVETAIARVTDDIIAIPDITADESERLKQICEVLKHVEEIFNSHGVNIVAYVPHWLRFCYVAEIMDASLADITYLFESGALVDFTSSELIHLILALFSDTPLRRDTIAKIHAA